MSISTVGTNSHSRPSPLDLLQNELSSEVSAGTISASDQSALSTALDSIDASLKSEHGAGQSSGARPSHDDIKSKITDLINAQVQNGTLTGDQATELQNVFQNAFANGPGGRGGPDSGAGGPGGPGGPGSPGGPDGDPDGDGSSTTSSSTSSTASDISKLLNDFLDSLQNSTNQPNSYDGTGATQSANPSLLFDYQS